VTTSYEHGKNRRVTDWNPMKEASFSKAEAPSLDLLRLAAHGALMKARVEGYEREDGTRVAAHERRTHPAQTPSAADRHTLAAARHEQAAGRYDGKHPRHGLHTELSALHLATARHAHRAENVEFSAKDRAAATQSRLYLEKLIAAKERDLDRGAEKPQSTTSMRKAVPVFVKSVQPSVKARGSLLPLWREMQRAQQLAKSHASEFWASGQGVFA
jgi:hypothetical protein